MLSLRHSKHTICLVNLSHIGTVNYMIVAFVITCLRFVFSPRPYRIKWVNDTHALIIFPSSTQGLQVLMVMLRCPALSTVLLVYFVSSHCCYQGALYQVQSQSSGNRQPSRIDCHGRESSW